MTKLSESGRFNIYIYIYIDVDRISYMYTAYFGYYIYYDAHLRERRCNAHLKLDPRPSPKRDMKGIPAHRLIGCRQRGGVVFRRCVGVKKMQRQTAFLISTIQIGLTNRNAFHVQITYTHIVSYISFICAVYIYNVLIYLNMDINFDLS